MKNNKINIESRLKSILTGPYCGRAVGYEDGNFIIYEWGDAPVGIDIVGKGETLMECLDDYSVKNAQNKKENKNG